MSQTRRMSLIEAVTNTVVGYLLAVLVQLLVFPMFGIDVDLSGNIVIALIFTTVSVARSFTLRRLFERMRPPTPGFASPSTPECD